MRIEQTLDRIHNKTVSLEALKWFTAFVRPLLGLAFIPPSIPKILHVPFTLIPPTHPVGHYFDALYKTGYYYDFIGWSQLVAAILLLIPRTSHIGALMFLPIIINITVLTNSVGFRGTWLLTIFMSLACLYLVCWDYPRWKSILFMDSKQIGKTGLRMYGLVAALFVVGGPMAFSFLSYTIGPGSVPSISGLAVIALICTVFVSLILIHHRFMRIGNSKPVLGE